LAFQIELARETRVDARRTGRRPKVELKGILDKWKVSVSRSGFPLENWAGYQMKLLKPRTRIETPVNYTTLGISDSNSFANIGNMGAIASGPKPWAKETRVAETVVEVFQNAFQFCKDHGVSEFHIEKGT